MAAATFCAAPGWEHAGTRALVAVRWSDSNPGTVGAQQKPIKSASAKYTTGNEERNEKREDT